MNKNHAGFTLIELLIAVAIVAILATIAYPQYAEYTRKIRRSEIAGVLVEEAQKLERFHSRAGQYSNVTRPPAFSHEVSVGNAFYQIVEERTERVFTLTAQPLGGGVMAGDACGSFVLSNTGRRDNVGVSGSASVRECWGR
jgi:type IV pilus assembly protein PilE